jgi:thiosulfate/3-mercaptopyruvate sulfurtransferase
MTMSGTDTGLCGPLVNADWIAARLGQPNVKIVDTRFSLSDTSAGRRAYDASHLPGAVYMHLDDDLSGTVTRSSGRHPLPPVEEFAESLGAAGIGNSDTVVVYDAAGGAIAARCWWMLRWLGHEKAAILDGGFSAWSDGGYPVESGKPQVSPAIFNARPRAWMVVSADEVLDGMSRGEIVVVDAREPERFKGLAEPIDTVAGRIPGAVNFPFRDTLTAGDRLLPASELRRRWLGKLAGHAPQQVVCMCGSGVTACLDLLAMELAGLEGARLYAGSWSEWIRDPDRPVAGGPRRD